jgi:8-oxo-dGTP pyrophosphatase MutT (NUDIX family)
MVPMASTVIDSLTVPWVAVPHRMDVLLADRIPEGCTVTTGFVLAVDGADRTLLTRVDRPGRGWEAPGGHLDPGESPSEAAARELAEEAGLRVPPGELVLLGGQRITLLVDPPADYRYPACAFMAFYTVRLDHRGGPARPAPGTECAEAEWVGRAEVRLRCPGAAWLPLHDALWDRTGR